MSRVMHSCGPVKEEITNECSHQSKNDEFKDFMLEDLWNYFEKGSAYGVVVPITLQNGQQLTQHFAPTLSAIQIFTINSSPHSLRLGCPYLHLIEYIPMDMMRNQKDLSTCFLTYHTLSYPFQRDRSYNKGGTDGAEGKEIEDGTQCGAKATRKEGEDLRLPPFGLISISQNARRYMVVRHECRGPREAGDDVQRGFMVEAIRCQPPRSTITSSLAIDHRCSLP